MSEVLARVLVGSLVVGAVGCGGEASSRPRLPAVHMQSGRCPVTRPVSAGDVPPALTGLAGSDAAAAFGKGGLWVLLPTAVEPNAVVRKGGYDVKVAWYLQGAGDLRVAGTRIDGPGRLSYGSAYAVPGEAARMQPSTLTISVPGCYVVKAEHDGASITWVFRAIA